MKLKTKSVGSYVRNMPQNTSDDTTANTSYIITLVEDGDDLILPLPDEILKNLDWNEGDDLEWSIINSVITLKKAQ